MLFVVDFCVLFSWMLDLGCVLVNFVDYVDEMVCEVFVVAGCAGELWGLMLVKLCVMRCLLGCGIANCAD